MAVSISASVANARAAALLAALDAGSGAFTVKAYSGGKPASVATAVTGTLLASWTGVDPAGSVSGNVLTLDFDPDLTTTVSTSGTPGYMRFADSSGAAVMDITVGAAGSGADMIFSSTSWVSGGSVVLESFTVTDPLS